jgi:hypothetical protein
MLWRYYRHARKFFSEVAVGLPFTRRTPDAKKNRRPYGRKAAASFVSQSAQTARKQGVNGA